MIGECFICGQFTDLETHHIFGGALRSKSDWYGLVVTLCPDCHRNGPHAVHRSKNTMQFLHEYGQKQYMEMTGCTKEEFIEEFYKNYVE